MKIFNSKTVFITIEFWNVNGLFDYPKHLPIPQRNDIVHFNGKYGRVEVVKHMTEGSVTEIKISCSSI